MFDTYYHPLLITYLTTWPHDFVDYIRLIYTIRFSERKEVIYMSIINGISDETLAAMTESAHPIDGDEASQAINRILFESVDHHASSETHPEAINASPAKEIEV